MIYSVSALGVQFEKMYFYIGSLGVKSHYQDFAEVLACKTGQFRLVGRQYGDVTQQLIRYVTPPRRRSPSTDGRAAFSSHLPHFSINRLTTYDFFFT